MAQKKEMKILLRNLTVAILVGGFESVSINLTWLFSNISHCPLIIERVYEEVHQNVGNRDLVSDDISKLIYTQAVINESLRLSPLPFIPRLACQKDTFKHYTIEKNDRILIPIFYMHRAEKYWENPEGFDPSRFLKPLDRHYRFVYLPFSTGPRGCLGKNFALLQMRIILTMVMQRYRLYLLPNQVMDPNFNYQDPKRRKDIFVNVYKV